MGTPRSKHEATVVKLSDGLVICNKPGSIFAYLTELLLTDNLAILSQIYTH